MPKVLRKPSCPAFHPFQLQGPVQQGSAHSTCEMIASFAPVEAGPAEDALRVSCAGKIDAEPVEKQFAGFSYSAAIAFEFNLPPAQHCIADAHREVAGHVIVASAGDTHGGIARTGAHGAPGVLDVLG